MFCGCFTVNSCHGIGDVNCHRYISKSLTHKEIVNAGIVVVCHLDDSFPNCAIYTGTCRTDIETHLGGRATRHIRCPPGIASARSNLYPVGALLDVGGPWAVGNCRVELPVDRTRIAIVILFEFHQPEVEGLGTGSFSPYSCRIHHPFHLHYADVLGVGSAIDCGSEAYGSGTRIVREVVVNCQG